MEVEGRITTTHRNPACVAKAIRVDNLSSMETRAAGHDVVTTISGTKLRSVIASADDYLMNLCIADEACGYGKDPDGLQGQRQTTGNRTTDNGLSR